MCYVGKYDGMEPTLRIPDGITEYEFRFSGT